MKVQKLEKPKQIFVFIISFLSCILFSAIVYYSGGTAFAFPHLFYFSISFSSLYGNWFNALFTPIFSAILLSPKWMPAYVSQHIMQSNIGWLFRSLIFVLAAIIIKVISNSIQKKEYLNTIKSKQMLRFQEAAFKGILNLAESADPDTTGRHLERLSSYAAVLLEDMKINPTEKENIISAIPFHDIGKVGIPNNILQKPGKLTDAEFEIVKQHPIIGGEIFENIERSIIEEDLRQMIKTVKELIYFHHERPDGKGYPLGLKGDEIPFAAKVAALCDVYDALSSKRPYKDPIPHEQCVEIIKAGRGTQFDEKIVDQFLNVHEKFKEIAENLKDEGISAPQKILESIDTIRKNKNKINDAS
jgi:putative two-component system response regulator